MNKKIKSFIALAITMILSTTISIFAASTSQVQLLKLAEKEYLIYLDTKEEFEFGFSDDKSINPDDIIYLNCALDSNGDINNKVAYIDETLYNKYFTDGKSTLYIRKNKAIINKNSNYDITLSNSVTKDDINLANNVTKKIETKLGKYTYNEDINGQDTEIERGKLVLNKNENTKYYYIISSAKNSNTSEKFMDMANSLNSNLDEFTMLKNTKVFNNLYNDLKPSSKDPLWKEVESNFILEPRDSKTGDKYVIWLMEKGQDNSEIIDVKFLTCIREEKGAKEIVVSKLPLTYDNILLVVAFILLAIVLTLLIAIRRVYVQSKH